VPKVKKVAGAASGRNVKAGKRKGGVDARPARGGGPRKEALAGAKTPVSARRTKVIGAKRGGTTKVKAVAKRPSKAGRLKLMRAKAKSATAMKTLVKTPAVRVAVKPLDPRQKCGAGTSVQLLYRVDETVDGRATHHLVFFDRHGWYCEHGRTCPAVAHAKKHGGQIARVS
jgi:hypothetical protein